MCDHHHLRAPTPAGDVDHVNFLSDNIGCLFFQDDYSDVTIKIENQRFPAHKVVLAARSEYFRALLFGGLKESQSSEVELKDTNAAAFHHLLKYIYTGKMSLSDLKEDTLLTVLGLAHQYVFKELQTAISEYLMAILSIRSVCDIYDLAFMYDLKSLCETCCDYMDRNAEDILQHEGFYQLSPGALQVLIARDSFCAPEIKIFKAVQQWKEQNPNEKSDGIISCLRLTLMSLDDLLNTVRPSSMMCADSILDAIKLKNESRDMNLNYRGALTPEENVASLRHGASVVRGEMKASLLDGDNQNYDLDRGFTRHPIDDNQGQGIVIKLTRECIINTVRMLLWDRDMRSYSYYIEVSMDEKDWVRVVDHTQYLCRSWQYLRFPKRVIRYLRVVGTHNTVNRVFHLVSFESLFSKKPFNLDPSGIVVPDENVATIEKSACVIEGVSRSRNALINGDTKNYDWDSGYTCHQLGSGAIVVQLSQCYIIDSMRLLLWDCDGRSYSYYIEVSTDQQKWKLVADKTREACRSWQTIVFEKQPVTFIRIVGTHNTANEVFHCVHFECPGEKGTVEEFRKNSKTLLPPPTMNSTPPPGATSNSSSVDPQACASPLLHQEQIIIDNGSDPEDETHHYRNQQLLLQNSPNFQMLPAHQQQPQQQPTVKNSQLVLHAGVHLPLQQCNNLLAQQMNNNPQQQHDVVLPGIELEGGLQELDISGENVAGGVPPPQQAASAAADGGQNANEGGLGAVGGAPPHMEVPLWAVQMPVDRGDGFGVEPSADVLDRVRDDDQSLNSIHSD